VTQEVKKKKEKTKQPATSRNTPHPAARCRCGGSVTSPPHPFPAKGKLTLPGDRSWAALTYVPG
jgi:hypothetical protein